MSDSESTEELREQLTELRLHGIREYYEGGVSFKHMLLIEEDVEAILQLFDQEIAKRVEETGRLARIDELSRPRNYHIDAGFSDHFHDGFRMALAQVTEADNRRLSNLNNQSKEVV